MYCGDCAAGVSKLTWVSISNHRLDSNVTLQADAAEFLVPLLEKLHESYALARCYPKQHEAKQLRHCLWTLVQVCRHCDLSVCCANVWTNCTVQHCADISDMWVVVRCSWDHTLRGAR